MKNLKKIIYYPILCLIMFMAGCGGANNSGIESSSNNDISSIVSSDPKDDPIKPGDNPNNHVHKYEEVETILHNCMTSATVIYRCECGASYEKDIVPGLDHNFTEWKMEYPATENSKGLETRFCLECDHHEEREIDTENHEHDYKLIFTQPADCENEGYSYYECSCKDSYTSITSPALTHIYGEWEIITNPTENSGGYAIRYCLNNEQHYEDVNLPSLENPKYEVLSINDSTCEEIGFIFYAYKDGDTFIQLQVEIPTKEHDYGEWDIYIEPTFEENGKLIRYCNYNLDVYETIDIPSLNNIEYEVEEVFAASCMGGGYSVYKYEYEGKTFDFHINTPIDSTKHHYNESIIESSCEKGGYILHECECGDSYKTNETDPLTHKYGEWNLLNIPSEDRNGLTVRYCENNSSHYQEHVLPYIYYSEYSYSNISWPNCVEDGIRQYTYESYDYSLLENIVISFNIVYESAYGHDVSFSPYRAPSCVDEGRHEFYACNRCGVMATDENLTNIIPYESTVIPTTDDHNYKEWQLNSSPTLSNHGELIKYCSNSYSHYVRHQLPYLNPDDYKYIVTNPAGCESYGSAKYEYIIDGQTFSFTASINMTGHNFKNSTFYNKNGHHGHCQNCGEQSELLAHVYINDYCEDCGIHSSIQYLNIQGNSVNNCSNVPSLVIIPSVYEGVEITEIEFSAFSNASSLSTLYINKEIKSIHQFAFNLNYSIENIYYNGTLDKYLSITFDKDSRINCDNLYCLNEEGQYYLVTSVELNKFEQSYAITNIKSITSLTLTHDLAVLSATLQEYLPNLESIYYKANSQAWFQNDFSLISKTSFRDYNVPIYMMNQEGKYYLPVTIDISSSVDAIDYHLYPLVQLEAVVMNPFTKHYSNQAFQYCVNLEKVYYTGDISSWCDVSFENRLDNPMYYATEFYVIENGEYVLLTEAVIGSSVKNISANSFYSFECINSFVIEGENTTLESGILNYCSNLQSLTIPFIGNDKNASKSDKLVYLFNNNKLPSTLTEINYTGTTIISRAFVDANYVTTLKFLSPNITGNVTLSTSLKNIYIAMNIEEYLKSDFYFKSGNIYNEGYHLFLLTDNGFSEIIDVVIPSSITKITQSKFGDLAYIESVTMSDSVIEIESNAFNRCSSLTTLQLSNKLTSIGDYAFEGCSSLTNVQIPNTLEYYGTMGNAFYNCSSLSYYQYDNGYYLGNEENNYIIFVKVIDRAISQLTIHDNTKFIAYEAISSCDNLFYLEIPENVFSLGTYAVSDCNNLYSITMYAGVKQMHSSAFFATNATYFYYNGTMNDYLNISYVGVEGTTSLVYSTPMAHGCTFNILNSDGTYSSVKDVIVDEEITKIGDIQFFTYDYLQTITLHNKITYLGDNAFTGCDNLVAIYYNGTIEEWLKIEIPFGLENCVDEQVVVYVLDANGSYIDLNTALAA